MVDKGVEGKAAGRMVIDTCIACLTAASLELGSPAHPESEVLQEALGDAFQDRVSRYFSSTRPVPL
jgi:hypothetical protein